ncbi:cell envelope integrity protein CreD [Bacteroidales bacterium AH-315-I05]|nr:cell envelope integrity protein CreD [Bacteroidales bacterium AH-315-I05]
MEQEKLTFFEKTNNWLKNSITIRLLTIGILILLLLIPVSMVQDLIREREYRQEGAIREVSSKWGKAQTVIGLVLTVPYNAYTKVYDDDNNKYKLVQSREYAHFLPNQLIIEGEVLPEMRYRGIYEVIVYNSKLKLTGAFSYPGFEEWKIKDENIIWNDAFVSLGLSDLRGIQENVSFKWNDEQYDFNPGIETNDVISTGISCRIPIQPTDTSSTDWKFSLDLNFNGSSSLNFIPIGKSTNVSIKSTWENPSFDGAFLPDNRDISKDGFTAIWDVLHLNRPYPQSFRGATKGVYQSAFGVNLIVPVDEYQKSMRSAKYASMFITLTFLLFFFVQILNQVRIHPIQYIIVGLALCVFYTLLIALSEHISFKISYLISSVSIITMITLYAHSIAKKQQVNQSDWIDSDASLFVYLFNHPNAGLCVANGKYWTVHCIGNNYVLIPKNRLVRYPTEKK